MRKDEEENSSGTLGTFAGVFTPSILTILGIILFLRMGYVVGAAGIGRAVFIIVLANAISLLTTISLATIATNLRVKGGGLYYLISRTLGVEFGGALGIVLFLAQSVSIALYALGFGEGVANVLGDVPAWWVQALAAGAVAVLFVVAWFGADLATKFQYVVMGILFTALTAFFLGGIRGWNSHLFVQNMSASSNDSFWIMFAIFFPAVTGFTQGVSMSGDLKDPVRSLPRGTFLALGLSATVYVLVAITFAGTVSGADLVSDYGVMRRVSLLSWLVDAGIISATLSSALASLLGAPRILQSLAADRVFPWLNPFAAGHGPARNPRRALLLAGAIAVGTIALGTLDLIAPIVAMFFLVSYGLLNYATYYEARTKSPSFRPTFHYFDPRLSLLGGLACLGAMLAINLPAGLVAVATLFAIYHYVRRTVEVARWSDSSRSHLFQVIRDSMHKLSSELEHPTDWRPILVAFSDDPARCDRLMRFAAWIEGEAGFTTVVQVIEADGAIGRKRRAELQRDMETDLRQRELNAFSLVVAGSDRGETIGLFLQSFGIGPIRANTVLLNWFDRHPDADASPGLESYSQYLRTARRFGCNIVVLNATDEEIVIFDTTPPEQRRIDVWYLDETNGQLMLLLAHLSMRSPEWRQAHVRVMVPCQEKSSIPQTQEAVADMLAEFRIAAEPCMVQDFNRQAVINHSRDATMVFFPFRLQDNEPACVLDGSLDTLVSTLPLTALLAAAQDIDLDAEPEEGPHSEIVQAIDAAADAKKKADKASREAEQAEVAADSLRAKLAVVREQEIDAERIEALEEQLSMVEKEMEALKRRAAKIGFKAESAAREADVVTGKADDQLDAKPENRGPGTE